MPIMNNGSRPDQKISVQAPTGGAEMDRTHESQAHEQDDARAPYAEKRAAVQADRFGGVKVGSAFFGWLTAMGMAVILTAVLAAAGTAVGLGNGTNTNEVVDQASTDVATVGLLGAIVLAVILFVSYYCGGYVAGRMARFHGAKQGVAVWLWALVIAVVAGIVGAIAGSRYDVLGQLNSFPRLPISTSDLTTAGVVALVLAAVTSLVGAVAGGSAGMRFHRAVDRMDLDA